MAYRVSAKEVAELAGVSRAAVSRTFGSGHVSAKVRERVIAAADTLGYRPNAIARSLIGGRSDLIAVVVAEHDSIHNSLLIDRLVVAITRGGKRALVIPASGDADLDRSALDASDYQVDAIVVIGGTVSPAIIERLRKAEVPLFLYERLIEAPGVECVICDNVAGGAIAARFLLRAGHTRLAYLTKPRATHSNLARREGFVSAIEEAGERLFAEAVGEQGFAGGFKAASKLFAQGTIPDAVFCFNDEMALGAMQAAAAMKLSVPGDVAVIGYDNIPMAAWPVFNLTTIDHAITRPIDVLMERIAARLEGDDVSPGPHVMEPELIVRTSTR